MKQDIPYIYILLYSKLKERAVIGPYMSKQSIDIVFKRWLRVPNVIRHFILEDMCALNLLQKINQREWKLLESNCYKELNNYKKYNKWITSLPD